MVDRRKVGVFKKTDLTSVDVEAAPDSLMCDYAFDSEKSEAVSLGGDNYNQSLKIIGHTSGRRLAAAARRPL